MADKHTGVSIIIPVYNAEKCLKECLDSIMQQTMTDFEVICIDDGSTDHSWNILESYASENKQIRIARQENQGPGKARNHGISLATGEYIVFVDSDDSIKPTALETICGIGREKNADIILYDGDRFDDATGKRIITHDFLRADLLPEDADVFSVYDCPNSIFQVTSPAPFTRAYRRELLVKNDLHFSELRNGGDLFFTYSCMAAAERIAFTTKKLYMHRIGQTSNVERGKEQDSLCFIEAFLELYHWLDEKKLFELCKKSFGDRFCGSIIHAVNTIDSASARREICARLCQEDVAQMHVLDQSDGFYGNSRNVRLVRYLLRDYHQAPAVSPRVSVIIPVFNVEKYLDDCLESLLNQTMTDFEVLCMDDGSTDNSKNILTLYSRLDSRIKVFFGENEGAAVKRNRGIDCAAGEYLYFMDSDDMAADTLLEKAYTAAKNAEADVVVFDIHRFNTNDGTTEEVDYCFRKQNAPAGKPVFSMADAPEHIFQISNPAPWTKMLRREFVLRKHLRFQNLQNANDTFFAHLAMALADRITLVDERLYFYRVGMDNNIQSKKESQPECVIDAYVAIHQRLKDEKIWSLCEKSWIDEVLSAICFTLKTVSSFPAYQKLYRRLCREDFKSIGLLEHEPDFYQDQYHYELLKKFMQSPIKFAGAEERDTKVFIPSRCENPVVSVIVPVYNVEKYLSDCLTSIQSQTFKDIEIICVDDGSTDSSLDILRQAAEADPRIQVLVQKNAGLSAARNAGIHAARGKYLYYIDSDDMLELDALQFLVERTEEYDLDCILFGGKTCFESEDLSVQHREYDDYYHYSAAYTEPMKGADLLVQLTRSGEYRCQACMQFVKAELVHDNGIWFYEGIIHEDELYSLALMLRAQRCVALPEQFYLRRIREGSIVVSSASVARLLGYLVCYSESLGLVNQLELTPPQREAVYQIQKSFIYQIQKNHLALSEEERNWAYVFCTASQKCIYRTLTELLSAPGGSPHASVQDRRLNDHDTALRYAQEELEQNRIRLNDHDTALRYTQEELAQDRSRLNDHDTALRYTQEELAQNRSRLNDHDTALRYTQEELAQDRTRLNDHDTALRYTQEELAQDRTRLNDHDMALRYTQEALAQDRSRLNDHDTALRYTQEEAAQNRNRLNDHDAALRNAQIEIAELRGIIENSLSRKITRIVLWLPRKIKRFLARAFSARE